MHFYQHAQNIRIYGLVVQRPTHNTLIIFFLIFINLYFISFVFYKLPELEVCVFAKISNLLILFSRVIVNRMKPNLE